jgi:hypothetical protein
LAVGAIVVPVVLLFPHGHLRSDRWRLVAVAAVPIFVFNAVVIALTPGALSGLAAIIDNPFGVDALATWAGVLTALGFAGALGVVGASFLSVFLRFREARGTERQQLKWFAYASGLVAFALFLNTVIQAVGGVTVGRQAVILMSAHPAAKAGQVFLIGAMAFIPVAVGIAVVRYRLYDIDLLINRTVVYGATSVAIGTTFFVGILTLTQVLRPITQGNELAVAASTLASFGLFQPIRRRLQNAVDRRFDRSRYDASRTLDGFADQLRDEVDLDTLRADLIGAVRGAMAPAHASLWLREGPR